MAVSSRVYKRSSSSRFEVNLNLQMLAGSYIHIKETSTHHRSKRVRKRKSKLSSIQKKLNTMNLSMTLATFSILLIQATVAKKGVCNIMECPSLFDQCLTRVTDHIGMVDCQIEKVECMAPCSASRKGLRMGSPKSNTIGTCVNKCNMEFKGCELKTFGIEEMKICIRNYEFQCQSKCKLSKSLQKMKKLSKLEKRLEAINRKIKRILTSK